MVSALRPYGTPDGDGYRTTPDLFQKYFGNYSGSVVRDAGDEVSLLDHFINLEHSYENDTQRVLVDETNDVRDVDVSNDTGSENATLVRPSAMEDVVTKFLRLIETQHLLGENCTAGTHLNLGEGVVDR